MKAYYYLTTSFILFFASCNTWRNSLLSEGNQNIAVRNAIFDFTHQFSNEYKKYKVFSVSIENINESLLGISILGTNNKLLPSKENIIGSNRPYFPTRYIIQDEKLFYWYDSTSFVNKELVNTLNKYNCIDSININGFVGLPESTIDERKKSTDYYFCKCDLLKYRKILTHKAMGSYNPPKLKCLHRTYKSRL